MPVRNSPRALSAEAHDCYQDYKAGGLSYEDYQRCLKRFQEPDFYGNGRGPRADVGKLDALDALLAKRPGDRFISSIRDQVARGRSLSEKQLKAVRLNMYRNGLKPKADHFRTASRDPSATRVAMRAAGRAVFDEWASMVPGAMSPDSREGKILQDFWEYHQAEGNEAVHLPDALEMAAWDLGYQGSPLRPSSSISYLAKIFRLDVKREWQLGRDARAAGE